MVANNEFIEHCFVHGNYYGTAKAEIERVRKSEKICILEIDVQGAQKVADGKIGANFMFIYPPSFEVLAARLQGRGTESKEQVEKRLNTAKKELEFGKKSGLFPHELVNDNFEASFKEFKEVLFKMYRTEVGLKHLQ